MASPPVSEMTWRTTQIFNEIVKNYLETGSPVGSGLIAAAKEVNLSSASVRAIMAELEGSGLLFSPHTSAGRVPTRAGLRLFVDGLMEVRDSLALDEHSSIDALERSDGLSLNQMLDKASLALSGLSKYASLVMAPTEDLSVNHIEFVPIQDKQMCRAELDSLTSDLVERGVAIWSEHADTQDAALILNGQANLLEDVRFINAIMS